MGGTRLEIEILRTLRIFHAPVPTLCRKDHVVKDIGREYFIHHPGMPRQSERHGDYGQDPGLDQMATAETSLEFFLQADRTHGQSQGGDIEYTHPEDGRKELAQQFPYFPRIGGKEVQEHVRSDDRAPEQVQQHHLESPQKEHREEDPGRSPRTTAQGHQRHVKSQGKQQERYARKRRNVLGKEQENIDRHQYRHEKPVEMALAGKPDVQTLKMLH